MAFFSYNKHIDPGTAMTAWANDIAARKHKELIKNIGADMMNAVGQMSPDERMNPDNIRKVQTELQNKYPDATPKDFAISTQAVHDYIAQKMNYIKYQQGQNDRQHALGQRDIAEQRQNKLWDWKTEDRQQGLIDKKKQAAKEAAKFTHQQKTWNQQDTLFSETQSAYKQKLKDAEDTKAAKLAITNMMGHNLTPEQMIQNISNNTVLSPDAKIKAVDLLKKKAISPLNQAKIKELEAKAKNEGGKYDSKYGIGRFKEVNKEVNDFKKDKALTGEPATLDEVQNFKTLMNLEYDFAAKKPGVALKNVPGIGSVYLTAKHAYDSATGKDVTQEFLKAVSQAKAGQGTNGQGKQQTTQTQPSNNVAAQTQQSQQLPQLTKQQIIKIATKPETVNNPLAVTTGTTIRPPDNSPSILTAIEELAGKTQTGNTPKFGEDDLTFALRKSGYSTDLQTLKNMADSLKKQFPQFTENDIAKMVINAK